MAHFTAAFCATVALCSSTAYAAAAVLAHDPSALPSSYRVASVMHTPVNIYVGTTIPHIINGNLEYYFGFVDDAAAAQAQLILFPESGTGYLQVPPPDLRLLCEPLPAVGFTPDVPCNASAKFVDNSTGMPHTVFGSCAARNFLIDVVINFCAYDAENGQYYNADVAFAHDGAVSAVYVKSHIVGTGPYLSQPWRPDAVTFTSSFGVKFGLFTCYDFWFAQPQREEMAAGVTDFLFPSEMAAGPPYSTVTGAAVGWSHVYGVNVIGASSFGTGFVGAVHQGTTLNFSQPMPSNFTNAHAMILNDVPRIPTATKTDQHFHEQRSGELDSAAAKPPIANTKGQTDLCTYGPNVNMLNFTYPCVAFTPRSGVPRAFSITNRVSGYTTVCNASVIPTSTSTDTWTFGAVFTVRPPTVQTPTVAATAMCLFTRCPGFPGPCMTQNMYDGWGTDFNVSSVDVTAQLGGKFGTAKAPLSLYPIATWSNNVADASAAGAIKHTMLSSDELNVRQGYNAVDRATTLSMRTTSAATVTVLNHTSLWSFGLYVSQKV